MRIFLILAALIVILIALLGIATTILSCQISKDEDMQQFQKDAAKGHHHGS